MKKLLLIIILTLIINFSYSQNTYFKKIEPCSFVIELPSDMKITNMYEDHSPDYCDFEVKLEDGYSIMELHSMNNMRFIIPDSKQGYSIIKELYIAALNASKLKITYKLLAKDFFVISGINTENGNIVYWKRSLGNSFISDMHIEYKQTRKKDIEPFIGRISKSFKSY
jgi:hypothetical protein